MWGGEEPRADGLGPGTGGGEIIFAISGGASSAGVDAGVDAVGSVIQTCPLRLPGHDEMERVTSRHVTSRLWCRINFYLLKVHSELFMEHKNMSMPSSSW